MKLSIKSLDTNYSYSESVKLEHWAQVIGYMQAKGVENHDDPKQFIDKVCKVFKSMVIRNKKQRFSLDDLKLNNFKLIKEDDV